MSIQVIIGIIVFLAIAAYVVRDQMKHVKGEGGGCCNRTSKVPKKKLQGRILGRKCIHVTGMHCSNCENHVSFALNSIDGVSTVQASAKKNKVVIEFDRTVDEKDLRAAVEGEGFSVTGIDNI